MRTRPAAAALLAATLLLGSTACGDDADETSSGTNEPTETTGRDAAGDGGASGDDRTGDEATDSGGTTSETLGTLPNLDALGEKAGDCMTIAMSYAGLALSAMGGPDGAKAAKETVEQMKGQVPEHLHDELDVVAKAFATVAEKGIMAGAEALETKEFEKADEVLNEYFDEICNFES